MILFERDWDKYPRASLHLETTNKSFIDLALLYRDMGIKNNAFFLALHDPDLRFVNPHDTNLDTETLVKIGVEIKVNPWYYLREVLRAPASGGTEGIPIRANRGNIALWWLFLNHATVFLIQPRQTGKSFNTDGLMTWLLLFRCDNTKINLLTKDDTLRRSNIVRIKDIISELPPYLDIRTRADANNGEEITILAKGNRYNTHVSQASEKKALNLGRGLTTSIFHIDEGPFISHIGVTIPAALSAMNAAIDNAKLENAPYGVIMTTTAGKKDDRDGKYMYSIVMESMVYDERKLFDCVDQVQLEQVVRASSNPDRRVYKNGVYQVNCTFSHRQLGYSDQWLLEAMERTKSYGDDANRDYFNIWTAGNEKSPISVEDAEIISTNKVEMPYERLMENGYSLRFHVPEEEIDYYLKERSCVLGLDTSNASGNDDIGLVIVDVSSLKVIAAGNYNETNLYKFGKYILTLLVNYPRLVANIEARSSGSGILDYLSITLPVYGQNPFTRLFNRVIHEKDESDSAYDNYVEVMRDGKKEQVINKYKKFFGYPTSGAGKYSRENLYGGCFRNAIKFSRDRIKDELLSDEILRLVVKNGRIDHDDYSKDDMVIAWLLAHWLITSGVGLDCYGIESSEIMEDITKKEIKTIDDFKEAQKQYEQNMIRKEINDLYNDLIKTSDFYLTRKIELRLRALEKRIVLRDDEVFSMDQLINTAKEQRKKHKKKY